MRFVSWQAVHDRKEKGLTAGQKRDLVETLQQHGRVLLSSESTLPSDLAPLRLTGPVEDIHHVMAHAQLVVGESATMSSEAAVLGVPAVFVATTGRGYTDDEERRYGLVRHFTEDHFDEAVATAEKLLADDPRAFGAQPASSSCPRRSTSPPGWCDYFESGFGRAA